MNAGRRILGIATIMLAAFALERGMVRSYDRFPVSLDPAGRTRTQEALARVLVVRPPAQESVGVAELAYNPVRGRPRPRVYPCAARVLTGENRGRIVAFANRIEDRPYVDVHLRPGSRVRLSVTARDGLIVQAAVYHLPIRWPKLLWGFAVLCAVLVAALGADGMRAVLLIAGCAAVMPLLAFPLLARGWPPVAVAFLAFLAVAALLLTLWGESWRAALCAAAGAFAGLAVAAAVALAASRLMGLTGEAWAIVRLLRRRPELQGLHFGQLLAAGMVIIAMGAAIDVAASVLSGLLEFARANPSASAGRVRRVGFRLNRNVAGTMVLTICAAWIALRLPVLVVMYSSPEVFTTPWMKCYAAELTQVVSAMIGVMLSGPATVLVFTRVSARGEEPVEAPSTDGGSRGAAFGRVVLAAALPVLAFTSPLWLRRTQAPSEHPCVDVSAVRSESSVDALRAASTEWQQLEEWDSSMLILWRALELRPDDPLVHRDLAYAYMSRRWISPARDAIRRALPKLPRDARAQYIAGIVAWWEDDLDRARTHLNRALRLDPSLAPAARALAALPRE